MRLTARLRLRDWSKNMRMTLKQTLPIILLVCGIIGVICAGILTVDKIHLLKHPDSQLGCDINPIVACGSVINTPQASAFGFPNPLIGLVGFGMIAVIGAAMLAGAAFKRWFWLCVQGGVTFGIGFVTWLQYQSIFTINALCPFCMAVWTVMIPLFLYVTLYNLREGHIRVPAKLQPASRFVQRHHGDILALWYLAILGVILHHFWYYWSTLL
jgi:uncharacterized membrane protein